MAVNVTQITGQAAGTPRASCCSQVSFRKKLTLVLTVHVGLCSVAVWLTIFWLPRERQGESMRTPRWITSARMTLHTAGRAGLHNRPFATLWRRWRSATTRRRVALLSATAVVLLGLIAWLMLTPGNPPPRARQYLAFKACLLTDSQGITGKQSAPVWAGMQRASLKTHARVQYQQVFGPATVPNALPYLASLVQRRCDLIMAAGDLPVAAAAAGAPRFPNAQFIVVGGRVAAKNISAVNAQSADLPSAVSDVLTHAVHGASE